MKVVVGGGIVLLVIVATLVIMDLASTPPKPPPGQCMLQNILPDRCISSCPSGVDCPTTMTRPYFWFWTEAAGCPDAVICG